MPSAISEPPVYETIKDGQHYIAVARLQDAIGTSLFKADVTSWRRRIYGLEGTSPETALHDSTAIDPLVSNTNADSSTILQTALQTDGYTPIGETGWTFKNILDLKTLLSTGYVGGRRYAIEIAFTLTNSRGIYVRQWFVTLSPSFVP
jgi:hypothetical protein